METTRIMPLHVGKGRTESRAISDIIDYVANPQKTDNGKLITGYGCDSRTADAEFAKELQTEYAKLLEEKKKTYSEYRRSREEMRELLTAKVNVDRVLKMEVEQDVEKEKDHGQR